MIARLMCLTQHSIAFILRLQATRILHTHVPFRNKQMTSTMTTTMIQSAQVQRPKINSPIDIVKPHDPKSSPTPLDQTQKIATRDQRKRKERRKREKKPDFSLPQTPKFPCPKFHHTFMVPRGYPPCTCRALPGDAKTHTMPIQKQNKNKETSPSDCS